MKIKKLFPGQHKASKSDKLKQFQQSLFATNHLLDEHFKRDQKTKSKGWAIFRKKLTIFKAKLNSLK